VDISVAGKRHSYLVRQHQHEVGSIHQEGKILLISNDTGAHDTVNSGLVPVPPLQ
jgi:hypothetical protein